MTMYLITPSHCHCLGYFNFFFVFSPASLDETHVGISDLFSDSSLQPPSLHAYREGNTPPLVVQLYLSFGMDTYMKGETHSFARSRLPHLLLLLLVWRGRKREERTHAYTLTTRVYSDDEENRREGEEVGQLNETHSITLKGGASPRERLTGGR
jgi:hypothetical protein